MAKLIQICASQNDLFGLDVEGVVYQYNFNVNSWKKLDRGRAADTAGPPVAGDEAPTTESDVAERRAADHTPGRRS